MEEIKKHIHARVLSLREEFIAKQEEDEQTALAALEKTKEIGQSGEAFASIFESVAAQIKSRQFESPSVCLIESLLEYFNGDFAKTEKYIAMIKEVAPHIAEELEKRLKRLFTFEDLALLDDRAVQRVLREVGAQELAKALKAASPSVKDKVFRNMSQRAAARLKEDMEFMGPVSIADVEESQLQIVAVVCRLEASGEIVVARAG